MIIVSNKGSWKDVFLKDENEQDVNVGKVRLTSMSNINFYVAAQKAAKKLAENSSYEINLKEDAQTYDFTGPGKLLANFELNRLVFADYVWTDFKWNSDEEGNPYIVIGDEEAWRPMENTLEDKLYVISNNDILFDALSKLAADYSEKEAAAKEKADKIEDDLEKK